MSDNVFSPPRLKESMGEMSNADLALKLGCSRSNITMYLSGERTPSKMTVQLMAICLGINPAWLMGLDVPKYIKKPATNKGDELTDKEREYLRLYRAAPAEMQEAFLAALEAVEAKRLARDSSEKDK